MNFNKVNWLLRIQTRRKPLSLAFAQRKEKKIQMSKVELQGRRNVKKFDGNNFMERA